mgnify:FL=1
MNKKKYTRREAIKYGAKVGLGAAIWGTAGNLLGRGYEAGRNFYREEIKPTLDKVEKGTDKIEEWGDDLNKTFNPWYKSKPEEKKKEKPELTRRSFLKTLALQAHEHPVAAGAIVGATYGAGKYAISGLGKYLTNRQIAVLKDENADYRERLNVLEKYRVESEKDLRGKGDRIAELEIGIGKLREEIRKKGKLEEKAGGGEARGKSEEIFLALGISGLLVSTAFASSIITGNVVSSIQDNHIIPLTAIIFILSLLFVFFGIRKRG